jgi:hypothetical protein
MTSLLITSMKGGGEGEHGSHHNTDNGHQTGRPTGSLSCNPWAYSGYGSALSHPPPAHPWQGRINAKVHRKNAISLRTTFLVLKSLISTVLQASLHPQVHQLHITLLYLEPAYRVVQVMAGTVLERVAVFTRVTIHASVLRLGL